LPDYKPVKQEVNGTVILSPLVFPGLALLGWCQPDANSRLKCQLFQLKAWLKLTLKKSRFKLFNLVYTWSSLADDVASYSTSERYRQQSKRSNCLCMKIRTYFPIYCFIEQFRILNNWKKYNCYYCTKIPTICERNKNRMNKNRNRDSEFFRQLLWQINAKIVKYLC